MCFVGAHLVKAFKAILVDKGVVENWRKICKALGLSIEEINTIDSSSSTFPVSLEEKCFAGLSEWCQKDVSATVTKLQEVLVNLKSFDKVAEKLGRFGGKYLAVTRPGRKSNANESPTSRLTQDEAMTLARNAADKWMASMP